jgi:ribonuclease P protein subunit RPR2
MPSRSEYQKPAAQQKRAKEEVARLFQLAESAKNQKQQDRYVELARKIAMKSKVKMPALLKRRFCKRCKVYFRFGENCQVRVQRRKIVYQCRKCKEIIRVPYR